MIENSPKASIDQQNVTERFQGVPAEVPVVGVEYLIPEDKKDLWKPGIVDSNGGLVAAHDTEQPTIHILEQGDSASLIGYEPGHAWVPLSGGDQDGWPGGRLSRNVAKMKVNAAARRSGVKGRTIQDAAGHEAYTHNPFDAGDYLDVTGLTEVMPNGYKVHRADLVTELSDSELSKDGPSVDSVGRFNVNNGTMAWVTPEGKTQIAPVDEERIIRLEELGYSRGDIDVPHSNGEHFDESVSPVSQPNQAWTNIIERDMERRGEKAPADTIRALGGRGVGVIVNPELVEEYN